MGTTIQPQSSSPQTPADPKPHARTAPVPMMRSMLSRIFHTMVNPINKASPVAPSCRLDLRQRALEPERRERETEREVDNQTALVPGKHRTAICSPTADVGPYITLCRGGVLSGATVIPALRHSHWMIPRRLPQTGIKPTSPPLDSHDSGAEPRCPVRALDCARVPGAQGTISGRLLSATRFRWL